MKVAWIPMKAVWISVKAVAILVKVGWIPREGCGDLRWVDLQSGLYGSPEKIVAVVVVVVWNVGEESTVPTEPQGWN